MTDFSDPYDAMGIGAEEGINVIPEVVDSMSSGTEFGTASMESLEDALANLIGPETTEQADMATMIAMQPKPSQIHILSTDSANYRVYMRSDIKFTSRDINKLCRFLDTRTEKQVVAFILGMDIDTEQAALIGPIVSAIQTCRAKTIGMAMGLCSLPETMIWSYCAERAVLRYGAICYAKPEFIKQCPQYESYFREAFEQGVRLGIITKEEVEEVFTKHKEIIKFYKDFG